jgi:hypothetical protein
MAHLSPIEPAGLSVFSEIGATLDILLIDIAAVISESVISFTWRSADGDP